MDAHGKGANCRIELLRLHELPPDAVTWAVLGELERERIGAMRSLQRQTQYRGGHWLARRMASAQYGGLPCEWQWQVDARGQPSLNRAELCLGVSLSHSGDWLACALSNSAVGVDVEVRGQRRDWDRLLEYAFPPGAQSALAAMTEEERTDRFLLVWCLQEARGKRLGDGIKVSALRTLMPVACDARHAEVLLWEMPQAYLALAAGATSKVYFEGAAGQPSSWRFEPAT